MDTGMGLIGGVDKVVTMNEMLRSNIVSDPGTINGNPRIYGTRLSVLDVVFGAHHQGIDAYVADFPELTLEVVLEALRYCQDRVCDEDGEHCGGCVLRPIQDQVHTVTDYINRFAEIRFTESSEIIRGTGQGVMHHEGTPEDLESNWRGVEGWKLARNLLAQ